MRPDSQESFDQIPDSSSGSASTGMRAWDRAGARPTVSPRMDIYAQVAARLLEAGYAYESYRPRKRSKNVTCEG